MSTPVYLPDELWLMVVNDLDYPDAASLARVNKQLYRVANEYLWTTFGNQLDVVDFAVTLPSVDILKVAAYYLDIHCNFELSLYNASGLGHIDIVTYLLNDDNVQINTSPFNIAGSTQMAVKAAYSALHTALLNGEEEVAILLLSRGAIPYFASPWTHTEYEEAIDAVPAEYKRHEFETALHIAAAENLPKVVDFLLQEQGMSVDLPNSKGYTPLLSMLWGSGEVSMANMLINYGADIDKLQEWKPVSIALKARKLDLATVLLDAGGTAYGPGPSSIPGPRHYCVHDWGNDDNVEEFAKQCALLSRLIDASTWDRKYFMHDLFREALEYGSPAMVSHMLSLGVQPLGYWLGCWSALDGLLPYSVDERGLDTLLQKISILIRAGVPIDHDWNRGYGMEGQDCYSLLDWAYNSWAAHDVRIPLLKHLLTEGTAPLSYLTTLVTFNFKPNTNKIEACQLLIDYGAALDEMSFAEPLSTIGWRLVDYRRDHWKDDNQKHQLLTLRILEIICSQGVEVEDVARWAGMCMGYEDEAAVLLLFNYGALTTTQGKWAAWIRKAARWGNMAVLKRLLEEGADVRQWWNQIGPYEMDHIHPKALCTLILSMRRRMKGETGVFTLRD